MNQAIRRRHTFQIFTAWKRLAIALIAIAGILLLPAAPHGQRRPPLTLDQVKSLLKIGSPDAMIATEIESRGVAFQPSSALLTELQRDGAGDQTLSALRKLILAERTICESFGGCMGGGQHAFHDKDWNKSRAYFEQATTISPNSGQAWNSLGKTYVALQQMQAAYSAWDKALSLDEGVALTACIESRQPICEGGTLQLTSKSLVRYKGDEKIFDAALSKVKVIGTVRHGSPSYLGFEMLVNGTKYGFDFLPVTVSCVWMNVLVCPPEGQTEQTAIASYFEQTIRRLASGDTQKPAVAYPAASLTQRDSSQMKISARHRHNPIGLVFSTQQQSTYCQGILSVYLGIVQYDCKVPDPTSGRCDHAMISPVRKVEYKHGALRLTGNGGNWDFVGNSIDLMRVHDAIAGTLASQK